MKTLWIHYTAGGRSGYLEGWIILPPGTPPDDAMLQQTVHELVSARVGEHFDAIQWSFSSSPPRAVMVEHLEQMRREYASIREMMADLKEDIAEAQS
jgi:hypothetical protein